MRLTCAITIFIFTQILATPCSKKKPNLKLVCYYSDVSEIDICKCTHIILPSNTNISTIENVKKKFGEGKLLITVDEFNQHLVDILNKKTIDGVDINLKKLSHKSDVGDFISTVKSKLNPDLSIAVSLPSKPEVLAKFYNLKDLSKHAEFFILQTAFLASSHNVTFHPSRLSGLWDTHNTDSVVDLVHGLGAPLSKIVISSPVQAFQFTLQNASHNIAGGPALDIKSITRNQLCRKVYSGKNWTLERDQDQAGPYVFLKNEWIAFEDVISIDIKAKYARVRGLAGLALKDLSQDDDKSCKLSLLEAAYNGLTKQARAPRSAVLQSLKQEILQPSLRPVDPIQISPYRISRIIDVKGNIHSVRKDTRTEFECSRQGYFMHPRSCGRFYRCVKFDQLSDDFNVFEFDCPDGLMFDSKTEVCVWPGSLPYTTPCSGSSEIAPVPRTRFICPSEEGYYADPENCRWFFACLDHGKSPLSAYEFRCPFGLMFDQNRLVCEWPWLVPTCQNEESIKYTSNNYGSLLNSYDGLGNLQIVNLAGSHNAANIHNLITDKHEDSRRNLYLNQNQHHFGQIIQPAIFGNNYKALSGNLNTGHNQGVVNTYFNEQHTILNGQNGQTGNNFNYQNRGPFYKTLAIPNEQARVVGGVSAVKYNSNNPQKFNSVNIIDPNSVSILNPSPAVAVAAAPVPFIGTNQNTNNFEVVANVPELQYKVIANQGTGYNVNNLAYSKGFSNAGSFSQNYNSNPLSRTPIYVANQGRPQIVLKETANVQPDLFSSKLNSYSVYHPVNSAVKNVGYSSKFDNSGLFGKIITSEPNVLEKDRQVLTQVISQSRPLLQSYTNAQAGSNGEQYIESILHRQPPVITSYNYDSRLNKALTQNNGKAKQQFLEADRKVVNLGAGSNVGQNNHVEYFKQNSQQQVGRQELANSAIGTSYFYEDVKPQITQYVDYPLYDYKAETNAGQSKLQIPQIVDYSLYDYRTEQFKPQRIQSFQSHVSSNLNTVGNITRNQQPAVVSSYMQQNAKINQQVLEAQQNVKFRAESNVKENIGLEYVKHNTKQQNLNGAAYDSVEVVKPAVDISYIYQAAKPQILQNYDYSLFDSTAEQNPGQFEPQRIQTIQSLSSSTVNTRGNTQKPAVVLEESVIIANPTPINPIANQRKSKIISSYSFQNSNNQNNEQKLNENIDYRNAAYENTQNKENEFSGYIYTTPNVNKQFLEISSSTPRTIVEQQKTSIPFSYTNFGKENHDKTVQIAEQNQKSKEQTAQSFSNLFFIPNRIFDQPSESFVISSTTSLPQVRESITDFNGNFKISSEENLRQNQQPTAQTYNNDYLDKLAEDERIFYNIKKIENGEREYEYVQPQVVFEEKQSKPLIIERFTSTAPKQLPNFSFKNLINEAENYDHKVEFDSKRIQPFVIPNINDQIKHNLGDYIDQEPSVELFQKPFQLVSRGKTIVENYNIKNRDSEETNQGYQEFEHITPSTSAPDTTTTAKSNVIEDFVATGRISSFQGYDYPKPSIEFQEGTLEDYKNRQPVQEEAIVAKQAYLTYDKQNGASGQFTTATPLYSPTVTTIDANKPTGSFYYSDSRLRESAELPQNRFQLVSRGKTIVENYNIKNNDGEERKQENQEFGRITPSTSVPVYIKPIIQIQNTPLPITKSTLNVIEDFVSTGRQSSFEGYDYAKPSIEFHEGTVEDYKNRQPVQEEAIVAKQAYLTYDEQNGASGQFTTAKSLYSPTTATIIANKPTGSFYYSDSRLRGNAELSQNPLKLVSRGKTVVENYNIKNKGSEERKQENQEFERITPSTSAPVYVEPIIQIQNTPSPITKSTSNVIEDFIATRRQSSFQGYDYPKPSIEFQEGTVEDYKDKQPVQEEPIVAKQAYLTYDGQNSASGQFTTAKSLYSPTTATIIANKPTDTFYYSDSRLQSTSNPLLKSVVISNRANQIKTDDYLTELVIVPKQTYLPTKNVEEFESELESDITISTKPPTTKTYVRINDAHPLLPAKLKAQCTCTSNTVTLRRNLPTTTPLYLEDDLYQVEKKEPILKQRKTIVIENYAYQPTTVEDEYVPVESISSTNAPVVVIKRKMRPVTSAQKRTSKIESISIIEKPQIKNLEGSFNGYELEHPIESLPKSFECQRAGLFRHPEHCNKFYSCIWDCYKKKFKLHTFNCPVHLTFDFNMGACNWPSKGPACEGNTLLPIE